MASNRLMLSQVTEIFETDKVKTGFEPIKVDDLIEATDHMLCVDHIIDTATQALTQTYIKRLHYERRKHMSSIVYTSYSQLPLTLNADQVASVLSISRANAYALMHSKGFPTIQIGKRMVVHRDKLIEWMNDRACA